jgi:predicted RNA-binding Zn ribbon-like protein
VIHLGHTRLLVTDDYHFGSYTVEKKDVTGQVNFNSHTDVVVAAAARLVNTLTPGMASGHPYHAPDGGDLPRAAAAALRAGRPGRPLSQEEAAQLRDLSAALRVVFRYVADSDIDAAARQVNSLLAATGAHPWLERHDGEHWHLHFHGTQDSLVTGWAAGCAAGLAVVLGGPLYRRLGVCTAPRCDRVYVDTSRNGTRRFCSTSCQNRVKAAAFRARRAVTGAGPRHGTGQGDLQAV